MGVSTATGLAIAAGAGAVLYTAYGVFWWYEGEKCEKPKYTVKQVLVHSSQRFRLRKFDEIEVREYAPYIVAETTVQGDTMKKGLSQGFRRVAGYIFGNNVKQGSASESQKVAMTAPVRTEMSDQEAAAGNGAATSGDSAASEKIAMTAPVQTTMQGGASESCPGTYKVSFVMPSDHDMSTLPVPKDSELELKEVPAHQAIVYTTFGASPKQARVMQLAQQLRQQAEKAGLKIEGDVKLYQYHPPFAPSILRRVEVLYNLK